MAASMVAKEGGAMFDSSVLAQQTTIPRAFVWPKNERSDTLEELRAPVIDLSGFFEGDEAAIGHASGLIRDACLKHGFFQVVNHGIDDALVGDALGSMEGFFGLPLDDKLRARRKQGSMWGYAGAHADRFSSKLPWKETLSFGYNNNGADRAVIDYFKATMGNEFEPMGLVYQKYCKAMRELSLAIMELLAISLGVDRAHYRDFFEDSNSIMRCNYYPPCQEPELTLGTGPHCDPTSLTILQQDEVDGLEVFTDGVWQTVRPVPGALVINIGDTFMALSNGTYKSCLHRAVVNRHRERRSLAFFLCPREDRVVQPPKRLVENDLVRRYPDFTWSEMLEFTQKHYRADEKTLQRFSEWIVSVSRK